MASSISLLGCGGGGKGMGGGQMSTIRGNVTGVMAMAPKEGKSSMLAQLNDFLSFSKTAQAQGSGVAESLLKPNGGGMTIDTDVTNQEGNFTLSVSPGNVTLIFTTPTLPNPVFTMVDAPENSMVDIAIAIQPTQVVVQQMRAAQNNMPSEAGVVNNPNRGTNSVIDRRKENSIRPEGGSNVSINAANITLENCDNGVRAKDNELHWHMYITGR